MNHQDNTNLQTVLDLLRKPFHPSAVTWKPGAVKGDRALALAYADLRAYMNRLDEVCGSDWAVAYEPWGEDRIICRLTILGITRSSTGETTNESERSEIGGTVAEAQAFKRACAMFGLGRYLYNLPSGWADFDPAKKQFTPQAKAKLTGILVQHYRRATDSAPELDDLFHGDTEDAQQQAIEPQRDVQILKLLDHFNALGEELYGAQWPSVRRRNTSRVSQGRTEHSDELKTDEIQKLISGMTKLKNNRVPVNGTHQAAA